MGEGDLRSHLEAAGHICVGAFDLPAHDARTAHYSVPEGVVIISNPPFWGQPYNLHPLIENLASQAPSWLLMNANWLHNKSSGPLMPWLKTIVSVGRVKWLVGTPYTSKDDVAWMLFGVPDGSPARFIGRESKAGNGRALDTNAPTSVFSRENVKALPAGLERAAGSEVRASEKGPPVTSQRPPTTMTTERR
jgi:hypothetical protein